MLWAVPNAERVFAPLRRGEQVRLYPESPKTMDYTIFDGLALSDLILSPALLATDAIINKTAEIQQEVSLHLSYVKAESLRGLLRRSFKRRRKTKPLLSDQSEDALTILTSFEIISEV